MIPSKRPNTISEGWGKSTQDVVTCRAWDVIFLANLKQTYIRLHAAPICLRLFVIISHCTYHTECDAHQCLWHTGSSYEKNETNAGTLSKDKADDENGHHLSSAGTTSSASTNQPPVGEVKKKTTPLYLCFVSITAKNSKERWRNVLLQWLPA